MSEESVINVYSSIGELLHTKNYSAGNQEIDLSNYTSGSYYIEMNNKRSMVVKL